MNLDKNKYLERIVKNSPSKWKLTGFASLPNSLIFDKQVSRAALLIYWILTLHLFKGKDYCFPSIETIAGESRYSRRTVIYGLQELEEKGYLEIIKKSGEPNKYKLRIK